MPFFGKKKSKDTLMDSTTSSQTPPPGERPTSNNTTVSEPAKTQNHSPSPAPPPADKQPTHPKLVFHCQQAHGSPTGIISGFTNVKELYQKIADCYDMDPKDILFCTLNTHRVDMSKLLGGQIGLDDFIFAHIRSQPKEIVVTKSEDALGLTITDNGAGYAFVKRIKDGSIMSKAPLIEVGDHIEKIDDKSLINCRHFDVARMLKEIPKGTTFTMRLVAPEKAFTSNFMPRNSESKGSLQNKVGGGKKTLRMKSSGTEVVDSSKEDDDVAAIVRGKINSVLETFVGINDEELAQTIWEIGKTKDNPSDFALAIDESEIKDFELPEDIIFDLWGCIEDGKSGRLKKTLEFDEQF